MMPRLVTVLEDNVRYRDGKKWKQRYCVLHKPDPKTGNIVMYITKQFGASVPYQGMDDKLSRQYIMDEITCFEYGRHVDKEGSVMALIGRNVVYCIAFSQNETMFRWAETLNKYFKCANFHVTLKKVSETSGLFNKIPPGIQGNLHIQSARLCLIGEPADGNKFICEWPIGNIVSIDIFNTDCDKVKELLIKSNGKLQKMKGNFEFEISFTQNSIFKESFESFLKACQNANEDFRTNFKMKSDSLDNNPDNTSFSYSILYKDMNCSNSDNSSSLEKRSSEIPIPRSREHSGPDQRPIDNVQIKIRKSNKNFVKALNENKKHFSLIETSGIFDHNACLFDDDEEIADQVDNKSRNILCNGLSQESSGVFVNGASSSTRETNLSARILIQDDSGCGNLSSTSSTHNDVPNVLPPSQKRCNRKENVFLTFYRNIVRNPLLLINYKKYYQLLKAVSDNQSQMMKRSNSFNSVHLSDTIQIGYSRKYSHSNFPLNLNYQVSDQHFNHWKKKISDKITENALNNLNKNDSGCSKHISSSSHSLSNRLPFRSVTEFHNSMIRSTQNGTACFNLFCYHHFLMLLNDLKIIIRNLESKQKSSETPSVDQNKFKIANNKQNIYNRWLEKIQSEYCKSFDVDNRSKKASILDINLILIFEIASSIFYSRKCYNPMTNGSCDCIPRHHSYYMTNPTIELNNDKCLLKRVEEGIFKQSYKQTPMYLTTGLVMCTSSSTPDFRHYSQPHQNPKQNKTEKEIKYQNLSSLDTFDTMNHTFPKQNISLNKSDPSENKGGSFKKFRRKYSPGFLMPFLHFGSSKFSNTMFTRRKTPSTHSTLSEPICDMEHKDQNNYYNILHQKQPFTKRSLSVVLDSSFPYEEPKECHNYINVQNNKGLIYKPDVDSNNYIYSGPSSIFDDNSYPEEIIDPSRNYGNLNFIKSNCPKMKFVRQDSDNQNLMNFRRSSLSILSNKSLQNFGSSRPTSFKKQQNQGYSNIGQIHSDLSSNTSGHANMSDYVNGNGNLVSSSSPQSAQSTQSCSPGFVVSSPFQRVAPPKSLNYVTVMENHYSHKLSRPLTICPPQQQQQQQNSDFSAPSNLESSDNNNIIECGNRFKSRSFKRNWMTPQSSPVVDYCQIDLTCTYALREVDRIYLGKMKSRDRDASKNGSPDDGDSCKSFDQFTSSSAAAANSAMLSGSSSSATAAALDSFSISSSCMKEHRKHNKSSSNKRGFRRLFSRKAGTEVVAAESAN